MGPKYHLNYAKEIEEGNDRENVLGAVKKSRHLEMGAKEIETGIHSELVVDVPKLATIHPLKKRKMTPKTYGSSI